MGASSEAVLGQDSPNPEKIPCSVATVGTTGSGM